MPIPGNHIVVVLSKPLNAAICPFLNRNIIVHDSMVISTALSSTISEDCLGRGLGVDEVMVHEEIVAKLMGNNLFDE